MDDRRGRTSIRAAAPLAIRAVLVAVLALALAACGSTPSAAPPTAAASPLSSATPTEAATMAPPTSAPSPSAAPIETEPAGLAQCEPADIKASHARVEGAAGSRFTTVELVAAIGCSVDLHPAFGLRDANGAVLVGSASRGPGRIDLVAGASYESDVRLANWCADDPAFPLHFELLLAGAEEEVTGATSFPEEGDVPPCNGADLGRILEASQWELLP